MNGGNNKKNGGEKELLARGEIRTMQKDMAKLQEAQAIQERERLAVIKTEEEVKREEERQARAKEAALARETAEKEASAAAERLKKLREEQVERVAAPQEAEIKEEEEEPLGLKETFRETRTKEEEERKRFLEKVEARAEGREEPPLRPVGRPVPPSPPPIPAVPTTPTQKIAKPFFRRPSFAQKLWVRVVLGLLILALIVLVATFWYWYLVVRQPAPPAQESQLPGAEEITPPVFVIPPALISTDDSRTLMVSTTNDVSYALFQALKEKINEGSLYRILIGDTTRNKFLGLRDFFEVFSISPPASLYDKVADDFTLFVYAQEEGNRIGFVTKIAEKQGLTELLTAWEGIMEQDTAELFGVLGKEGPALAASFKAGSYQGTAFRFQTFNRQDLGLVYSIFNDYFIFTASFKSLQNVLDKLKAAPSALLNPDSGAESVFEKLTLAEKIGQLFLIGVEGKTFTPTTAQLIKDVHPGGVILLKKNIEDESQTRQLIQDLQNASLQDSGLPLFIAVDQEGGLVAPLRFGQEKTPLFAIQTLAEAYYIGLSRGEELKELGFNLNLSPVLDVANPGDFLFNRSFQKDIADVGTLAKALILGQKEASILTAIKHFPGYGTISSDPEKELQTLDKLPDTLPFREAMGAKPELVMVSNAVYEEIDPDLPFAFSAKGIKLLKEVLGDNCLIMTDDLPQEHLLNRFSLKGMITLPIEAGVDILTFTGWSTTATQAASLLAEAVKNNEITEARINQSVSKILKLKSGLIQ